MTYPVTELAWDYVKMEKCDTIIKIDWKNVIFE